MKKKTLYRITAAMGIALCSLSLFFAAPQSTITAQAAGGGESVANPQSDIIHWIYGELDGKLYKRLWNGTTQKWLTDWIYVRDL